MEKKAVKMPEKGHNILKFNNFYKQLPKPFVICADFEAITEKVQGNVNQTMINDIQRHTEKTQTVGRDIKLYAIMMISEAKKIQIYTGENSVYKFMEKTLQVHWCKTKKKEF